MENISRYHVATVWLSRDGFASANADYLTITQQHTAFTAILPCSRRQQQENTYNRTSLYLLTSVSIKTMCKSRQTDNIQLASQRDGKMVSRSGITTKSKETERKRLSVSKQSKIR